MAQNSIPSASVQAKKAALLEMEDEWRTIRDPKTGQRRIVMPNLTRSHVYYVDPAGRACSCKAAQNGLLCGHRLAVIESLNHAALSTWIEDMVKPRKSYEALFPKCRRCDDLSEGSDGLCYSCSSADVYRRDQERKAGRSR